MITFTVLASSSGANAVLATTGRTTVLLDCGLSVKALYDAMLAHGYDPAQIDAVMDGRRIGERRGAGDDRLCTGPGIHGGLAFHAEHPVPP